MGRFEEADATIAKKYPITKGIIVGDARDFGFFFPTENGEYNKMAFKKERWIGEVNHICFTLAISR